jgi:hypothetical protein
MATPISHWRDQIGRSMHLISNLPITSALFFFAVIIAPIMLVGGSVFAGRIISGITVPTRQLICRFSFALIPLAFGMWAAHFLFHFFIGWNSAGPILQRAFADVGLAVAGQPAVPGFSLHFRMEYLRMLQTALLDIGLLGTLYLGWRVAREYAPRLRLAFRVVAPWSTVAVVLYGFGIWTCLQPMQMRGLPDPMAGIKETQYETPSAIDPKGLCLTLYPAPNWELLSGQSAGSSPRQSPATFSCGLI